MSNSLNYGAGLYCMGMFHVYPESYAGHPQFAEAYLSRCKCGKKKKVTTVTEVDAPTKPPQTRKGSK